LNKPSKPDPLTLPTKLSIAPGTDTAEERALKAFWRASKFVAPVLVSGIRALKATLESGGAAAAAVVADKEGGVMKLKLKVIESTVTLADDMEGVHCVVDSALEGPVSVENETVPVGGDVVG